MFPRLSTHLHHAGAAQAEQVTRNCLLDKQVHRSLTRSLDVICLHFRQQNAGLSWLSG
jgi:hypothetical protein